MLRLLFQYERAVLNENIILLLKIFVDRRMRLRLFSVIKMEPVNQGKAVIVVIVLTVGRMIQACVG